MVPDFPGKLEPLKVNFKGFQMSELKQTQRTKVNRARKRASYDKEKVYALVDLLKLGHVAFVDQGSPLVIPMLCWRVDDYLYLHGARVARIIENLSNGMEISVGFTRLQEWVMAKSAFHHSANYESAVLFGKAEPVLDEKQQMDAYESFIEQLEPGRWKQIREPNAKELKATGLVRMRIDEGSYKARNGGPIDDDEDMALPVWAGTVPVEY